MVFYKIKEYFLKKRLNILNKNIQIEKGIILSQKNIINFSNYIYIGPRAKIYGKGKLNIGENVIIGPDVTIFTSVHNYHSKYVPYGFEDIVGTVQIENNVWIGANVILMPNIVIGEGAVIGAGSVVTKDVAPLSIIAGNPAKVINMRPSELYDKQLKENNRYLIKKWDK